MPFLNDGFSTTIELGTFPTVFAVVAREKTVTPSGYSGGGGIPVTTMRNIAYRTTAPKYLINVEPLTLTVAYDPDTFDPANLASGMPNIINVNQLITITFPSGDSLSFYGFVDEWKSQENREGEQPLISMTIIPSLLDPTDNDTETAPVYVGV